MASDTARPKIQYVLFDMDGLLIDSERVYTEVTDNILARYGKKMSWEIKSGLMGKPDRAAGEHLLSFFPDISLTLDDYLQERDIQQDLRWPHVQPLPGAIKLITHLHKHHIPIAIATGTRKRNLPPKTSHLPQLIEPFGGNIVCGDDERIRGRGKPFPDIFLLAAETLGRSVGKTNVEVDEEACEQDWKAERGMGLVFEDAIPGIQAAKRAGMSVVWVPDPELLKVNYDGPLHADQILKSLEEFKPEEWGLPPYET